MSVVLGFDAGDGQLIAKWREAFQHHGVLVGEFFHGEQYVEELRRHTSVSRVVRDGKDVLEPLVDSIVRVARGGALNASGISKDFCFDKWHPQAWRMQILSIDGPPTDLPPLGDARR